MIRLAEAKRHLNLAGCADDDLLLHYIAAARDLLESQLGYRIADRYPTFTPPALDVAALMLVAHWYENREATLVGVSAQTMPFGVANIVADFRDYSWGEADDA